MADVGNISQPDDVCRDFLRNVCNRGKACRFQHPVNSGSNNWNPLEERLNFCKSLCHDFQVTGALLLFALNPLNIFINKKKIRIIYPFVYRMSDVVGKNANMYTVLKKTKKNFQIMVWCPAMFWQMPLRRLWYLFCLGASLFVETI